MVYQMCDDDDGTVMVMMVIVCGEDEGDGYGHRDMVMAMMA